MDGGGEKKKSPETARLRLKFRAGEEADVTVTSCCGRILSFSINYRTFAFGSWRNVVRYDTAHGVVHLHRLWKEYGAGKPLGPACGDMNAAFKTAYEDVIANWKNYRKRAAFELEKYKSGG